MIDGIATYLLCVAAGSALGGVARFVVSGLVARRTDATFPWGTMAVNVSGSFGIGLLAGLAQSSPLFGRPEAWPLVVTGFLGSYTTVSSFSLQTLALLRDGQRGLAAGNVALSLALCLAAVAAGAVLAQSPLRPG